MSNGKFSVEDRVCRTDNRSRQGTIIKAEHPYYSVKWDRLPDSKIDGRTNVLHYERLHLVIEKPALAIQQEPKQLQIILPENFDINILANAIADKLIEKLMDLRFKTEKF